MRCYEKNPYWASCKTAGTCKPGVDPNDPPEYQDPWTCKDIDKSPAPTPPPPAPPVDPPPDADPLLTYMSGNLGTAKTTRYWDCCKPSCGWPGKARVSDPVAICDKDGETKLGSNAKNACGGGGTGGPSYMCTSQQPWYDAQRKVSFGFAAAHVGGQKESQTCCACYELRFEKNLPRMVVQVGNTGADLAGNQFDIQVPGGGFGIFDACSNQWNLKSKTAWGCRYGGIMCAGLGKKGCDRMPKQYRRSCEWHFDYLGDNPRVSSVYRVACPAEITKKSGCKRDDDAKSPPPPPPGRRRSPPPPSPRRRSPPPPSNPVRDGRRRTPPTPMPVPSDGRRRSAPAPSDGRRRSSPPPAPPPPPPPADRRRTRRRRRRSKLEPSKRRRRKGTTTRRRKGTTRRRSTRRRSR